MSRVAPVVDLADVRRVWVAALLRCTSCGGRSLDVVYQDITDSIEHVCTPCGGMSAVVEVELCPATTRAEAEDIARNHGAELDDVETW